MRTSRSSPLDGLLALDAFYWEHRLCGELDGGGDEDCVWVACDRCEVRMLRGE